MPRNTIYEIKPIDVVKNDIECLKQQIIMLQDEVKKLRVKVNATESIVKDNNVKQNSGWWW